MFLNCYCATTPWRKGLNVFSYILAILAVINLDQFLVWKTSSENWKNSTYDFCMDTLSSSYEHQFSGKFATVVWDFVLGLIFNTMSRLNPSLMQDFLKLIYAASQSRILNEFIHHRPNQVRYRSNSLLSMRTTNLACFYKFRIEMNFPLPIEVQEI